MQINKFKMAKKNEKQTLYTLTELSTGRSFPIYLVQSIGFKYANSIIKYETVGDEGGETVNGGKLIQSVPVTIMLIGNMKENMAFIRKLIDTKEPFTLFTNIDTAKIFGTYLIESVDGNITDGADSILLNINLTEYKKALINKRNFTLVESKNLDNMLLYLKNQNQIDKR